MHHLSPETISLERQQIEYADEAYMDLITEISKDMPPNHDIIYVPLTDEQVTDSAGHFTYASRSELPGIMKNADSIIVISRDEDPTPQYTDQHPEYNITLTASGRSNVDASVVLYNLAHQEDNEDLQFIATGRMHNRAVRTMLALPVVAEHIGINAEDVYHIPEARFRELLDAGFSRENISSLQLDPEDPELGSNYKALISLFQDPKYGATIPTAESTDEDLQKAADAIWQEYKAYPRISTSRLMIERAAHEGVPLEALHEEDSAVDTITNLINIAKMLESAEGLKDRAVRRIVIVAGSDHLPRTMWIADHILPDNLEIVCVESDPALTQEAYDASCTRELNSFRKGSKWIGGTRDLDELTDITEAGYFGVNRKDATALAREVASAAKDVGTISLRRS